MKTIFTSILTFCILAIGSSDVFATSVSKAGVVNTYSYLSTSPKPSTPSSVLAKLYNSQNQLEVEISSSSKNVYSYNEQGLVSMKKSYSWNSTSKLWTISTKTTYVYDQSGLLSRENSYNTNADTLSSYREFTGYENGVYNSVKTMNYNGSKFTYWNTYKQAYDNNGLLTSSVRYNQTSETTRTPLDSTVYSYTNGKKTAAALYAYNGTKFVGGVSGTWTETFAYNDNGDLTTDILTSISRYGNYVSYNEYIYGDYDSSFAPTNLTAVPKTGNGIAPNLVTLSWTAAPSAAVTGYKIVCDTIVSGIITGTTYTTSTSGQNGAHEYAVIAVAGSDSKNMSNRVSLTLNDTGVIPAANVRVTAISGKKDSDGSYDVTVAWDAPQTTSVITKYRIYYTAYSYIETTATSGVVNIASYNAEGTNSDGDTYGLNVSIYVVAMYETGTAGKSNVVVCNPYNGTFSSISETTSAASVLAYPNPATDVLNFTKEVSATVYSLSGTSVKTLKSGTSLPVADLPAGVYFVKMRVADGTVSTSKIIIK